MDYSLYYVNSQMGYFERTEAFRALNDEVAISVARRKAGDQPLELWCGGRLVSRFDSVTAPSLHLTVAALRIRARDCRARPIAKAAG